MISVSLYELIDEAIDFTRPNLTEKNIALRVDLPDELPELGIDRDALQQALIFLLQNAGAATPSNGEIALYARPSPEQDLSRDVLVQVIDEGGGISAEDLPKIFSRLSYTDGSGISGVGDKGIGLALAKQLIETQRGRIWVESQLGVGSTFNILLPTYNPHPNGDPQRKSEE